MANDIYEEPLRLKNVKMSTIRKMMDAAAKLKGEGRDVVAFTVGEPDFNTPQAIKDATADCLNENLTHYTSNRGRLDIREEVSKKILSDTGILYNPEKEILMTSSGAEAINNALFGMINEGDEVILITPSFVSYEQTILMCGGVPVYLPLKQKDNFQIDKDELESKVTAKTRFLIMNNPCNPTGGVLNDASMNAIAEICVKYNLAAFSDEIYSQLIYDGLKFHSIAEYPGMRERTVMMNGFSKTYAMTGWRVGYLAMDERFMKNILRVHQYSTTTGVTFIQAALARTMNSVEVMADVDRMVKEFERRRNIVVEELSKIDGISFVKPSGAFYVLINIGRTGMTGEEFANRLLNEKYVSCVPAIAFGAEYGDYIRISFATGEDNIRRGICRIKEFVDNNMK